MNDIIDIARYAKGQVDTDGDIGALACAYLDARWALQLIKEQNPLHHDLDAYLFDLAEWGQGLRLLKPSMQDYGLED